MVTSDALTAKPEAKAREQIDRQLTEAGWIVQDRAAANPHAAPGVAIREFPLKGGPVDYVLYVDGARAAPSRPRRRAGRSPASSSSRSDTAKAFPTPCRHTGVHCHSSTSRPARRRSSPTSSTQIPVAARSSPSIGPRPTGSGSDRPATSRSASSPQRGRGASALRGRRHPPGPPEDAPAADDRRPLAAAGHRHPQPRGVAGREQSRER